MTQEDKNLLLKVLCEQLPYGVMIEYPLDETNRGVERLTGISEDGLITLDIPIEVPVFDIVKDEIKPYLRPMSSMTKEEKKEYKRFCVNAAICSDYQQVDFLNKHHFDYRGLIEKGLALEAPEGMYC